jgi:hypothetical protein
MEPKHDDSGAQKEAQKFYLSKNKFEVPHVGTFELHLKEPNPYVELFFHPAETTLARKILDAMLSATLAHVPRIRRPGEPEGPV